MGPLRMGVTGVDILKRVVESVEKTNREDLRVQGEGGLECSGLTFVRHEQGPFMHELSEWRGRVAHSELLGLDT